MNRKSVWTLIGITSLAMVGCSTETPDAFTNSVQDGDGAAQPPSATPNMKLTVDIDGDTDVSAIRYTIEAVACNPGESFDPYYSESVESLEDLRIPGMIPEFEDNPLDEESGHLFADHFEVLPAGCYDVSAQPLNEAGAESEDCIEASASGVVVRDGLTTEILLISQCEGEAVGALDTAVALNHPPQLLDLEYDPSKFVFECEWVDVCATFIDYNGDPLRFQWEQTFGPTPYLAPNVISTESNDDGSVTQCVEVALAYTGDYEFKVTAWDMTGNGETLESYIQDQENDPTIQSRDDLVFPFHVNWDIELACYDADTDTFESYPDVRTIDRAPGCTWTTPAQFYCNSAYVPDTTCTDPADFDPSTVYPACE